MTPLREILALITILLSLSGGAEYGERVQSPPPPAEVATAAPILVPVTLRDLLPLTEDGMFLLLERSSWPADEHETVVAVSWCESRWTPSAVGARGERGVLQVRPEFHGPVPADPLGQLQQAHGIWESQGWSPWSCYR